MGSMILNRCFEEHLCSSLSILRPAELEDAERTVFYNMMTDFEFDTKRNFSSREEWDSAVTGNTIEIPDLPGFFPRKIRIVPGLDDKLTTEVFDQVERTIKITGFVCFFTIILLTLISYRNMLAEIFEPIVKPILDAVRTHIESVNRIENSSVKVCTMGAMPFNREYGF